MCPVQATQVATAVVMAGMARRDDGIGLMWWELGLRELRYADAMTAVRDLVAGGIGERKWITARDVIRRVRSLRAARHDRAPEPVPPSGLTFPEEQKFRRWYWIAVGNGDAPAVALDRAALGVGADRYLPPVPPETGEPVDPADVARVRGVLEAARDRSQRRGR